MNNSKGKKPQKQVISTLENYALQHSSKRAPMTIQNKEVVQLVSSFSPGTSVRPSEKKSTSHLNTTAAFGSSTGSAGSDTRLHGELHRRVGDILEAKLEARRKELERLPSSSNDYTYPSPAADAEEHVNPSVGIRVQPLRSTAPAPHSAREPVSKRGAPSKHSRYVSSVRERVEKFREADEQEGSPLELVRVNRLVAVPDHDRTMMAGCSTAHTTPSGNYIVGGKVDDRVRSSEWYRLHGGEGDVRPGFMAMRSYADDFRLFFQWCANPYRPSPQEEEVKHGAGERHGNENEATAESSAPGGPAEGKPPSRRVSAAVSGDMANTLSDILGLVEEKYGKPLTQEERDAANKRLQELRAQRKSALEGMTGSEGQKEVHSPSAGSGAAAGSSAATGSGGVQQGELESGASGLAGSAAEGQLNAGESGQADHNANTMHGGVPTQGQGDLTKDTAQSGNAGRAEGGMEGGESEDAMNPSVPVVAVPGDKSAHGNTPSSGDGGTAAGDEGALSGMPGASQGKGGAESFPSGNTSPQSVAQEGSTAGTESGGKFTVPTFGESGEGHASDTNPIAPPPSGRHNLDHTVTEQEMEKMQSNNDYSEEGNTKSGGGNDVNGNNANDSFASDRRDGDGERTDHRKSTSQSRKSATDYLNELSNTAVADERPFSGSSGRSGEDSVGSGRRPNSVPPGAEGVLGDLDLGKKPGMSAAEKLAGNKNKRKHVTAGGSGETGGGKGKKTDKRKLNVSGNPDLSMSSLLSDNEDAQHLDLFLVNFPDTDTHVKLRKQANGIFKVFDLDVESGEEGEEYDDEDGGGRHRRNNKYHNRIHGLFGDKQNSLSDSEPEDIKGFDINEEKLTERFNLEAREELADLFAQRRKLLGEVTEQKVLLQSFTKDIYHLSKGKDGMDSEFFAIELTKDVNRFAREHQLRLSRMLETATAENIEEVADGFLSRFGKGRPDARDVGTQVTDQDLGYMDEGVQQAESRLNDLYFHEKGLIDAIKLATVAVANIMSFHASLELESTCKECFYIFESPRTLWPCGHTFCLPCLSGMYNRNEELICAECGSLCETGYTPNLTIELVSNYQLIREVNPTGAAPKGKGKTIESVLRNLLADLVSTQHNYTVPAVPSKSPQRISFE